MTEARGDGDGGRQRQGGDEDEGTTDGRWTLVLGSGLRSIKRRRGEREREG